MPETENDKLVELLPDDLEALQRLFIASGGNPTTKTFQAAEMRAVDKAHLEVNTAIKRQQEAMHPWALAARNLVLRGMEIISVLFTVVLVLFGMLIGSGLLVIAEVAAVYKGFQLIEPSGVLALLYAGTTVLFFLTVLFIREIIARKSENEPQPAFSLRLAVRRLTYFLGVRKAWSVEYRQSKPLLQQVDHAITALTYTMILFGLLGRLQERMSKLSGNWLNGLEQILTQSSLQEMVGLVGAVVMTMALLSSTHFILYFVHLLYVRVTGGGVDVTVNFSEGLSLEAAVEREKVNLYKTEVLKLYARTPKAP
jgi:hypothetical protein